MHSRVRFDSINGVAMVSGSTEAVTHEPSNSSSFVFADRTKSPHPSLSALTPLLFYKRRSQHLYQRQTLLTNTWDNSIALAAKRTSRVTRNPFMCYGTQAMCVALCTFSPALFRSLGRPGSYSILLQPSAFRWSQTEQFSAMLSMGKNVFQCFMPTFLTRLYWITSSNLSCPTSFFPVFSDFGDSGWQRFLDETIERSLSSKRLNDVWPYGYAVIVRRRVDIVGEEFAPDVLYG